MSSFRIRPRFKHRVEHIDKDDLEKRICNALKDHKQFSYNHLTDHIYIKINLASRHIWSPQLHLSFEQEDTHVIVRGLYGPNPTVWAFFFFGYVVIGIAGLFLGMWGFSLYTLGQDASILWAIPVSGVIGLLLYLFSQTGQKLGAQQMFDIHHFYEGLTHDKIVVN